MDNIQNKINEYYDWLKDKTALKKLNRGWFEIETPYLDRYNDYIQIYIKKDKENYILSDGGYTIEDLEDNGVNLNNEKRKEILKIIMNNFNISLQGDKSLTIEANESNFKLKKHGLIQSILAIGDMFYLSSPVIKSLFFEEVALWFKEKEIRAVKNINLTGKTGFKYPFDFAIAESKNEPERIIKVINNPTREKIIATTFSWEDTRAERQKENTNSVLYTFLNDKNIIDYNKTINPFRQYGIKTVIWSEREKYKKELIA